MLYSICAEHVMTVVSSSLSAWSSHSHAVHCAAQDRRGALQALKSAASAPRLQPGDLGEVLAELKKILTKDSNLACVTEVVACLGASSYRRVT